MQTVYRICGIVGTGAMGRGIAQMAAQAGSEVILYDAQEGAAQKAREALAATWEKLVEKGKLDAATAQGYVGRLSQATSIADLASCDLVVEAIVEKLDVKQRLFQQL